MVVISQETSLLVVLCLFYIRVEGWNLRRWVFCECLALICPPLSGLVLTPYHPRPPAAFLLGSELHLNLGDTFWHKASTIVKHES